MVGKKAARIEPHLLDLTIVIPEAKGTGIQLVVTNLTSPHAHAMHCVSALFHFNYCPQVGSGFKEADSREIIEME